MKSHVSCLLVAAVVPILCSVSSAEITESTDHGATIQHRYEINGFVDDVYLHFERVGTWWSSAHSWSGDSRNMTLTLKPGGAFLEALPNDGFVEHMRVIYVAPQRLVRLKGALGPFQEKAVDGTMTVRFESADQKTKITVTYAIGGFLPGGFTSVAPVVDGVIDEQFHRLKQRVEGTLQTE
ncbi:MAG: SRPBCC family protein [Planctomycetaceae bacterium]|nr:SRPBCC family protein [Planctomycetaceae bacterium]